MKSLRTTIATFLITILSSPCFAMISVGELSKGEAKELGITMKHRKNGDAGVKVWLEFKKEGFMEKFTYCELRVTNAEGKHAVSAMLQPNPVNHRQHEDIVTVAFSAEPAQLKNCSFFIVAYGSDRGGVGYMLQVKDFLNQAELQKKPAEKSTAGQPATRYESDPKAGNQPQPTVVGMTVNAEDAIWKESDQGTFLQRNTWWNFYCDSEQDPIKRSIRAVKVVETNTQRPNWVKITFPRSRDEHRSIFGPAARANRDKELSLEKALIEWEQGISKWDVIWINLRFVTQITKVEQDGADQPATASEANPKGHEEAKSDSKDCPQ